MADDLCATCVWRYDGGRGPAVARCRARGGARLAGPIAACPGHEARLDCQACAACCRAAYGSVTVTRRDPIVKRHPELVVARPTYLEIRRAGDRCAALAGPEAGPWACTIYEDRARCCREFTEGGEHCLVARRRLGLSRGSW